jgi:hypothetical protein
MKLSAVALLGAMTALPLACSAQQSSPPMPDAPSATPAKPSYTPQTQQQRFDTYIDRTYSLHSLVEAALRGGIAQARDNPSGWPQGAQGYGERVGSAAGEIVIRGTTEYLIADLFHEDLRRTPCGVSCPTSRLQAAFEDTFTARKGPDGHLALSVARIVGPFSGSLVATNAWYPAGSASGKESVQGAAVTFGFIFVRNLLREALRR